MNAKVSIDGEVVFAGTVLEARKYLAREVLKMNRDEGAPIRSSDRVTNSKEIRRYVVDCGGGSTVVQLEVA